MNNNFFSNLFKSWKENTETRKERLKWKAIWFKRNLRYGKKTPLYIYLQIHLQNCSIIKFPEIEKKKKPERHLSALESALLFMWSFSIIDLKVMQNFSRFSFRKERWNVLKSCRISNLSSSLLIQPFFIVFDFTTVRFHSSVL